MVTADEKKTVAEYLIRKIGEFERRLNKLRSRREGIDREIGQVERFLAAVKALRAEEMHRLKEARMPGEPISTLRFASMTLKDAVHTVLEEAAGPIHVDAVLAKLRTGGAELKAKKPKLSVASVLYRETDTYRKVAPATFELIGKKKRTVQNQFMEPG